MSRNLLLCMFGMLVACLMAIPPVLAAPGQETAASGQPVGTSQVGLPFLHHFDATDYGGSPQNWSITQGLDGVIYVGNVQDGVLAYDGTRWQRIPTPSQVVVRSLATAPNGRIYVGTVGDFGYLKADAKGQLHYASLLDLVPENERHFADVWSIHVSDKGVYFGTLSKLLHLHDGKITVIKPHTSFHIFHMVAGTLYVVDRGLGLMKIQDDKLVPLAGGKFFQDKRIYALLPSHAAGAKPGDLLVGTRNFGWFIYADSVFRPWHTSIDKKLKNAAIYGAHWLAGGQLAINTLRGGVFVLDKNGQLLRHLDRDTGLHTNAVFAAYQDRQHGLWLATGQGVSRIDIDSPLTHLDKNMGLPGAALDIARFAGTLYVGTTEGLYHLIQPRHKRAHFKKISGTPGQIWSLQVAHGQLLVAGNAGIFTVGTDHVARPLPNLRQHGHSDGGQALWLSSRNPSRVFVAYTQGIGTLHWNGTQWVDEGLIQGTQGQSYKLVQDGQGKLWYGDWAGGIYRLTMPLDWQGPADTRPVQVDHFDSQSGLPGLQQNVALIDGQIRFLTTNGVYQLDKGTGKFIPDPTLVQLFPDANRRVIALQQDRHGNLWMYTENSRRGIKQTGRAIRVDGQWQWRESPLQPLSGIGMVSFDFDDNGIVWIGGDKGLFRFDTSLKVASNLGFTALIRQVATREGSILQGGQAAANLPVIPYAQNALSFELAAPSFSFPERNRFQVWLHGVDPGWSAWLDDTHRDYTNISEGEYRFQVRARNVYDQESKVASFEFRILPPWYRSAWAIAAWVVLTLLLLVVVVRWRSAALHRRNSELEDVVKQRTTELARVNKILQSTNSALQDSNEALAQQNITDPLTSLGNRRHLLDHIAKELELNQRYRDDGELADTPRRPASDILFLLVDIDHFKQVNDNYGHAAGDLVLRQMGQILHTQSRNEDLVIRWGGEEFLLVTRTTSPKAGPLFAERIRAAVAAHSFDIADGNFLTLTCSLGFATCPARADNHSWVGWDQVVNMADECMYVAKHHGRNAWVGVMPTPALPDAALLETLHTALADLSQTGTLNIRTSWDIASTGTKPAS